MKIKKPHEPNLWELIVMIMSLFAGHVRIKSKMFDDLQKTFRFATRRQKC